jgi:hypothetical protein
MTIRRQWTVYPDFCELRAILLSIIVIWTASFPMVFSSRSASIFVKTPTRKILAFFWIARNSFHAILRSKPLRAFLAFLTGKRGSDLAYRTSINNSKTFWSLDANHDNSGKPMSITVALSRILSDVLGKFQSKQIDLGCCPFGGIELAICA